MNKGTAIVARGKLRKIVAIEPKPLGGHGGFVRELTLECRHTSVHIGRPALKVGSRARCSECL